MSSTQTETTTRTQQSDMPLPLPRTIAKALLGIGAAWARYGLTLGRASIEAYARTLQSTSGLLGDLADAFERKAVHARSETAAPSEERKPDEPVGAQPPPAQA